MEKPTGVSGRLFCCLAQYLLKQMTIAAKLVYLLLPLSLMSCGNVDSTQVPNNKSVTRRFTRNPNSVATAVALKHGLSVDTILAAVGYYAGKQDRSLLLDVKMDLRAQLRFANKTRTDTAVLAKAISDLTISRLDTAAQNISQTRRFIAEQFKLDPSVVGAVVYDYKLLLEIDECNLRTRWGKEE